MAAEQCYEVSWDDETGLARIVWRPGAVCGLEEARAVDAEIEALGQGPVRCLVDLRQVDSIDRPARELFMDSPHYAAVVLMTGSASTRMLANFFLGLKRGTIPVKMFNDESEAVTWLQAQR